MRSLSLSDDKFEKSSFVSSEGGGFTTSLFFELFLKAKFMVKGFNELRGGIEVDRGWCVEIAGVLEFALLGAEFCEAVVRGVDVIIKTTQGHILQGFH